VTRSGRRRAGCVSVAGLAVVWIQGPLGILYCMGWVRFVGCKRV
jgi:hypothetical protein